MKLLKIFDVCFQFDILLEKKGDDQMADRKLSDDMAGAWGLISKKEKLFMVIQSVLSGILILLIILDTVINMNHEWTIKAGLCIVILLCLLNAIKNYPARKKAIVFYVALTLAAVVCFILQFV